jgi:hypothetical protein
VLDDFKYIIKPLNPGLGDIFIENYIIFIYDGISWVKLGNSELEKIDNKQTITKPLHILIKDILKNMLPLQ